MNVLKLVSAVTVLILTSSAEVNLTENFIGTTDNTDVLQPVINQQSLALFMPAGIQIATEIVTSNDEGC